MQKIGLVSFMLFAMFMISGCELAGGIFKAGMWVGILVVVAVIALIVWLVGRGRR